MMNTQMKTFPIFISLIVSLTACKKEPESKPDPNSKLTGALFLNKKKQTLFTSNTGSYDTYSEYMVGFFQISGTFDAADPGTIHYGDSSLKNAGGFRYLTNINNPQPRNGFTGAMEGGKAWSVSGNAITTVPAFNIISPATFPSLLSTSGLINGNRISGRSSYKLRAQQL